MKSSVVVSADKEYWNNVNLDSKVSAIKRLQLEGHVLAVSQAHACCFIVHM